MNARFSLGIFLVILTIILLPHFGYAESSSYKVGNLEFTPAPTWKAVTPSSSMRAYEFQIMDNSISMDMATLSIFYFGQGQGGNIDANLQRWVSQFKSHSDPKIQNHTANLVSITIISVDGTFMDGMPLGPKTEKTDYALIGAIAQGPQGDVFFKMTGPKPLIKSEEDCFFEMTHSIRIAS